MTKMLENGISVIDGVFEGLLEKSENQIYKSLR